jgi:leucyl/phenylalanyl-tRNA--protein transferase
MRPFPTVELPALLDERLWFPDPASVPSGVRWDGLIAIGGDLSVPRLLLAYRAGIFPWSANPITWWSPNPRGVLELENFHVSQSLAKVLRKGIFTVTMDRAFHEVMKGCSQPRAGHPETWISDEFLRAYGQLHGEGHAHSVEVWQGGELVGGVYGVSINGFFSGESMFHRASNASKVALYHLVHHLRARGFSLFDVQMVTPHTRTLGATEISRLEYLARLKDALRLDCRF